MRALPWVIIFVLLFTAYAFFGMMALGECIQREPLLTCLFDKGGWKK